MSKRRKKAKRVPPAELAPPHPAVKVVLWVVLALAVLTVVGIFTYGMMEPQPFALRMQEQMIAEIETTEPAYVVFVNIQASWLADKQSHQLIFEWSNRYAKQRLERVGLADIVSATETKYYWDADALDRKPQSSQFLLVFKKKKGRST